MSTRSSPATTRRCAPFSTSGARNRAGAFAWPALLLAMSGTTSLVFQVLWIKQLSLVVGVEIDAITAAVSAFFGGLALGNLLLGRLADRVLRPVRLYARLEIGIAILSLATTLALARAAPLFASLESVNGALAWTMVFMLVGIPAVLMGGTLPALGRCDAAGRSGGSLGGLYAANTAGAVLGALLPTFVLIPAFGVQGTACAAAALSLSAAAGALLLDRLLRLPAFLCVGDAEKRASAPWSAKAWIALGLYAVAGGIALGYEIVWSQLILPFMSTRSFAFSIVLATYLTGLACGAALYATWSHRVRDPWGAFGLLVAAAGLLSLIEVAGLGHWLVSAQTLAEVAVERWTGSVFAGMCGRFAVAAACIVLLPTLCLGAAFPAALALIAGERSVGEQVGTTVAVNGVGGIAGTVLTGFVFIPWLGVVHTLALLAGAAAVVGAVAVASGGSSGRRAMLAIGAAAILAATLTPADKLARLLPAAQTGAVVFYEESRGGTVAVVEQANARNRFHRLYIQGVSNSGDAMPSLRYMRLQALLPLIIHDGDPRSALVIGYGTGITAGALSHFTGLSHRVVAEVMPAVLRAAPLFEGTFGAATDPGPEIRLRDGRRELQRRGEHYDLITLEPPPPSAAGVVNLYSSDFYRLAASRLNGKGIVAQWLPLPTQNEDDTRALVRSFVDVFPYASLWTTELHETLLVGSFDPIVLDVPRVTRRFEQPETASALGEVGVASPAALLATWVTDRDGLARFAGKTPAVTDDRPGIEYATWVRHGAFGRTLSDLLDGRSDPPTSGASDAFKASLATERRRLDTFYVAGLSAYAGDRAAWARAIAKVAQEDGDNPYYRWFLGPRQP